MQAQSFYQSQKEGTIPLFFITQNQWKNNEVELSSRERNYLQTQKFQGKLNQCCLIYNEEGNLEKVYVGQGEATDDQATATAANLLPAGSYCVQQNLSFFAEVNWALAQYKFGRYKKHDETIRKLFIQQDQLSAVLAQVEAIYLVRDLINTPTNDMSPQHMAQTAEQLADKYQAEFKQWVGDELLKDNFPAIHAVGRASVSAPRLLQINWGNKNHPCVTLVGKGVCFDSGGLDIKPADNMRLMKKDMGGAAQVLGLAQWIMETALPIRLQVLIPAVENAIGPEAYRPGDVLAMRNGLNVEVDNTDAEGRLVLADALVKACEGEPQLLIDFATLTGAARVAVGTDIAAMFTPDDALADFLNKLSAEIRDPVWRMPLYAGYESMLNSNIADLINSPATSYAGSITAALFLKRFVSANTSWVHFDIMAWNLSSKPGKPEGGEAMAIRTLAAYLKQQYGK